MVIAGRCKNLSVPIIHLRARSARSRTTFPSSRSLSPRVSVVQTSHAGQADHLGSLRGPFLDGTAVGSVADRGVDALGVVVVDVFPEQSSQLVLAHDHHVIEKLSANRSHEAFRGPVLPGTFQCGSVGTDSESRDGAGDVSGEDRVVVEDEVAMRRVIGEGLSQLLNHPAG